ncbi:KGG domain-containing protein [Pigmentiphaga litoralis]|uniref:General stress protein YciG n=1 Tax=Pigmentiphaga litoralis TaxID=516702 RepID=A0A7Y9ITA1_9BURK|nr:KGG domain-containing protein [Pigmentiphaga litoralis]NYE23701.1 general stress protein YciG [Pigmentiphaga litoralis]NYE82685.1 general stress protein YciG [Pigmentiphaga litoralis]
MTEQLKTRRPRGFAAMDPDKQKALASAGGRAAHRHGRAHQFTEDEARQAGAKGRAARQAKRIAALNAAQDETREVQDEETSIEESELQT